MGRPRLPQRAVTAQPRDVRTPTPWLWVRLNNDEAVFRAKTGRRWPPVRFDESNARHDWHRKNWFTYLAEWLRGHGGGRLLTRWTRTRTKHAGPWPPSQPVIRRLRWLSSW